MNRVNASATRRKNRGWSRPVVIDIRPSACEISGSHSRIFPQTRFHARLAAEQSTRRHKMIRARQCDGTRRDAMRRDAFVERFAVCRPRTARPLGHLLGRAEWWTGRGGRFPRYPRARSRVIVFPLREAARGGGPGVCLIRGNILMSRRITSYVCFNLSCSESRARRTHDRASRLNEHYSIIFKFNEFLVNNINEPYGIGRIMLIKI